VRLQEQQEQEVNGDKNNNTSKIKWCQQEFKNLWQWYGKNCIVVIDNNHIA
jgi:hypothetical protein